MARVRVRHPRPLTVVLALTFAITINLTLTITLILTFVVATHRYIAIMMPFRLCFGVEAKVSDWAMYNLQLFLSTCTSYFLLTVPRSAFLSLANL